METETYLKAVQIILSPFAIRRYCHLFHYGSLFFAYDFEKNNGKLMAFSSNFDTHILLRFIQQMSRKATPSPINFHCFTGSKNEKRRNNRLNKLFVSKSTFTQFLLQTKIGYSSLIHVLRLNDLRQHFHHFLFLKYLSKCKN